MKEIKRTRTVEEVVGYEASDGVRFKSKEECQKYEESAKFAVTEMFLKRCVCGEPFIESAIFENFGYGGEEYEYVVMELKDAEDVKIATMFASMHNSKFSVDLNQYIGKRVLVGIGFVFDSYDKDFVIRGTEGELIDQFKHDIARFFRPEENLTK